MKLIRYLRDAKLLKSVNVKQPNGTYVKTFYKLEDYKVQIRNLEDEISATVYGSNINKMLSISTALGDLESYLIPKVANDVDNISYYFVEIGEVKYKIVSVKSNNIVLERL